ncbi:MAG: hypothetical protein ABIR17_00270 [Pseudolysinimonas sp.]|uniref:hypothetical protein n=1 Tax=Pseudolysinimonas sp. TaxID=2680009 RepID=UPI00326739A4
MFEPGGAAAVVLDAPDSAVEHADVVRDLQARIRSMQRNRLDTRAIPTHPALGDLLPGGALAAGSQYQVVGSTTLALALLQGPSSAGAWCAIVGVPDLGVEAAAGLGIDLERLVLVPHPGEQWMSVVSALVDVVSVVLVRPPVRDGRSRVPEAAAGRLASRLRQREAVLVSIGDWPRADAALTVSESAWSGLGSGFGHLTARQVTVSSASASWQGRVKSRRLWMPGVDQQVAMVEPRAVETRMREVVRLHSVAG